MTTVVQVAAAKDVISMSEEGIGSAYVNAHGFVHDMITLRDACNLNSVGEDEPQTENSWFPGYGWTIVYCDYCRVHLVRRRSFDLTCQWHLVHCFQMSRR